MEWHDQTQWYKILFVGDAGEYKKKKKKKERQLQKKKPQKYYGSNPVPLDLILLQYCQQLMDLSLRPPLC